MDILLLNNIFYIITLAFFTLGLSLFISARVVFLKDKSLGVKKDNKEIRTLN